MIQNTDMTTVEFADDRVYNKCKALINIDHQGHITVTYIDTHTGDDLVMVYLGKNEIKKIVNLFMENPDLIENEGEKDEDKEADETPAEIPAPNSQPANSTAPTVSP